IRLQKAKGARKAKSGEISYAPGWTFGNREHPIGFFIAGEFLSDGIEFQGSSQLFGDAAQQQRAGGTVSDVGIANGRLARADALEEIPRVAVAVVKVGLIGSKGV